MNQIHHTNFDIVIIGNVGIDSNVYTPNNTINLNIETNFTENIDYIGQAGGYSARGFAQLGYKTAFIGYVGDDFEGKFILEEFTKDGINIDGVFIDPAGTSRSINLMNTNGKRKNFYDGKSHLTLQPNLEICKSILQKTKLAHFNIPNWARHLLPIAKELGVVISSDIQDVTDITDSYRNDFIHYSDVLFFSSVNQQTPDKFIEIVLNQYPDKIVISGMGEKGCAVGTKSGITHFNPAELSEPVIDTNGAGDGLATGFLAGYYLEKMNLEDAVEMGQTVARYTCGLKADTSHLIRKNQLVNILKNKQNTY